MPDVEARGGGWGGVDPNSVASFRGRTAFRKFSKRKEEGAPEDLPPDLSADTAKAAVDNTDADTDISVGDGNVVEASQAVSSPGFTSFAGRMRNLGSQVVERALTRVVAPPSVRWFQ